ncbi:hypothetical protein OGA58_004474 [Salmonella enterica]|nr:hypothetical protein [Salmonella enterica]
MNKGVIDTTEYYPFTEEEKQHLKEHVGKHWPTARKFSDLDIERMNAMHCCYAIAKHRGVEGIKDMIDWMHKD